MLLSQLHTTASREYIGFVAALFTDIPAHVLNDSEDWKADSLTKVDLLFHIRNSNKLHIHINPCVRNST